MNAFIVIILGISLFCLDPGLTFMTTKEFIFDVYFLKMLSAITPFLFTEQMDLQSAKPC